MVRALVYGLQGWCILKQQSSISWGGVGRWSLYYVMTVPDIISASFFLDTPFLECFPCPFCLFNELNQLYFCCIIKTLADLCPWFLEDNL